MVDCFLATNLYYEKRRDRPVPVGRLAAGPHMSEPIIQ